MSHEPASRHESLGVCALLAAALAVRLSSWRAIFRDGRVFFVDTDDYYHLRRIMTAAAHFPRLPAFDPYLGFPAGFHVNWPPLYDLFVGALTLVFGLGRPSLRLSATVAAFVPPLAGVATLWLFHRVVRRVAGRAAALWALGFAALLPPLVFYTMLGRPDHHCFENLWLLAALLPALSLAEGESSRPAAASFAMALALAAGVSFWIGSLIFSCLLCAWTLWDLFCGSEAKRASFWFAAAFLMEAALLLGLCAASPWTWEGAVLFDAPSLFQPLAAAALGLATLGLYWRRAEGWSLRAGCACAAAFLAAVLLASRGVASVALYAGAPPWVMRTFEEMQPLLAPLGPWSLANVRPAFGWAFWTLPILAWLFARRGGANPASRRLVVVWTLLTGALCLSQTRYALHFALPAALLLGWGCAEAARRGTWRLAAVLLVALALLAPALKNAAGLPFTAVENISGPAGLIETCDWLREHTPATRSLWRDEGAPEYGVFALHSYGDQITAIAQRPAVAGNMHFLRRQMLDSITFFFLRDPQAAYDFLQARRFRYVLFSDLVQDGTLADYARQIGLRDLSYRDLVYLRLYAMDGSLARDEGGAVEPIEHFRLVHESRRESSGVHDWKVFEVVTGARVYGACRPGAVEASVPVLTDAGREFSWRDRTGCIDGRFALHLPYPGNYVLNSASGRPRSLAVTEAAVESGAPIKLSLD
jgi:asparagine N-glycosylation enzyme membrane subunit Stt3